jgi:predicted acylesterase/phospholipase RssA
VPDELSSSHASATQSSTHERFQVLSLDGGGAKALFTAHVLACLEADLGVHVTDHFDLIAGTSAGGILALSLGAGLRPAEIVENYTVLIERVFPGARRARWRYLPRAMRPAYSGAALREVLAEVLGTRLLRESCKRLIIPSWDMQRGEVHIFKTPHHARLRRDGQIPMVDIAMATTAIPSYFEAACVNDHHLIDGGVWANNPSVVAIGEAVSMLDVPLNTIRILNIGTIGSRTNHQLRRDVGRGPTWATPAVQLMITASSRGTQGTAIHLVGKENFVRFDANVAGDVFTLDRASPTALARLAAEQSRVLAPTYTDRFADHVASPYTPNSQPAQVPDTRTPPGGTS